MRDAQKAAATAVAIAVLKKLAYMRAEPVNLDDVDFSWQIACDLKANFLLAHCGLCPGLHSFLH